MIKSMMNAKYAPPEQIPLPLLSAEIYLAEKLQKTDHLKSVLSQWLEEPIVEGHGLFLVGSEFSGKTHLAKSYAQKRGALYVNGGDKDILNLIKTHHCLIIDDAELIEQEALFHILNHTKMNNKTVSLTAEKNPNLWDYRFLDVKSRLNALTIINLPSPDEETLKKILIKMFNDRFIKPSDEIIDYILAHYDRSIGKLSQLLDNLVVYSNGKPFTRALVRSYLYTNHELPL